MDVPSQPLTKARSPFATGTHLTRAVAALGVGTTYLLTDRLLLVGFLVAGLTLHLQDALKPKSGASLYKEANLRFVSKQWLAFTGGALPNSSLPRLCRCLFSVKTAK
jgi:hypothetical protein